MRILFVEDDPRLLRNLAKVFREEGYAVDTADAGDAARDRVRGLDTGADDYLVEPFDRDELLARVRALIRRSAGQGQPEIVLGGIVINPRTRIVTRDGQPVTLTARE